MWLIMHKQTERESYSHRKRTKATMVEGINPITNLHYCCRLSALSVATTFPLTLLIVRVMYIIIHLFQNIFMALFNN